MIYNAAITNEELMHFPLESFPGKIVVVEDNNQVESAVAFLYKHEVIGFDTETRPSFVKGKSNLISLIQLATSDTCFLFRVNRLTVLSPLIGLINDGSIKKIGISLRDDFFALKKAFSISPTNFVDLQQLSPEYGIEEKSLRKIYAIVFAKRISKSQRLSNWEIEELTHAQQLYAATDAWACLNLYKKLKSEK